MEKAFVLKKHRLAHTRSICPRCNILFAKARPGRTNREACERCQIKYSPTHQWHWQCAASVAHRQCGPNVAHWRRQAMRTGYRASAASGRRIASARGLGFAIDKRGCFKDLGVERGLQRHGYDDNQGAPA
jgi:hypothetical protein